MLELALQVVLMVSLAGIVILGARLLPRVPEPRSSGVARFEKWVESLPLDRIDTVIKVWVHKVLRRLRLVILRIDNQIGNYLEKTKENGNGNGRNGGVNDLLRKENKKE